MHFFYTVEAKTAARSASGTGTNCKRNMNLSLWVITIVLAASAIPNISGSAIPMWEFLSRDEKMSHLFNLFAKQAAEYCKSSSMPDCNKVILIYGLTNLAKMDDTSLDQMDPYQRGANDKIWESMMKDSDRVTSQSPSEVSQSGYERDYYSDALEPISTDENYLGSASNNVEENISGDGDSYTDGENDSYMGGPMIVRVQTDGSPIPDQRQTYLPKDEDMEEHKAMRSKLVPSVSELQSFFLPSSQAPVVPVSSQKDYPSAIRNRYNILRSPYD